MRFSVKESLESKAFRLTNGMKRLMNGMKMSENDYYVICLLLVQMPLTIKGEIVSVDGMIFGPRHVLCIVGRNKITTDVNSALDRIRNYVTPLTYLRHINKHFSNFSEVPCLKTGRCAQCSHDSSACRDVVIVRGQNNIHKDRIHL